MRQNETSLTAKQAKAIECLLSEPTQEKAAQKAKISRATLSRWLTESAFQRDYREARKGLLEAVLTSLQAASIKAVETLNAVMGNTEAQPSARVSAARTVLDNLLRSREQLEIEERLQAIEARLQKGTDENTATNWTN